jgi:16S rRNA (uracil1498-N3)-methyltransferase
LEAHVPSLRNQSEAVLLIGPEGDFSPEEAVQAKQGGARLASLGRATLRAETAAVAALAILQHALGAL